MPVLAGETCLADQLHLREHGHPLNEAIMSHMQMAKPSMLHPSFFFPAHHQVDRLCDVDVKHVGTTRIVVDLREQASVFITHTHHTVLPQHLVATFIQFGRPR